MGRRFITISITVCGIALLYQWVLPWDDNVVSTASRASKSQRAMLRIRCFILPIVILAHIIRPPSDRLKSLDVDWALSTALTTLWPRSVYWNRERLDNVWSWIPVVLMNLVCRCFLGLLDVIERGRLGKNSWEDCWRFWQHTTSVVCICVGYVFFHNEPGEGRWRKMRSPDGRSVPELRPHLALVMLLPLVYLFDAWIRAVLDPLKATIIHAPFVVGFSQQVLLALVDPEDSAARAVWFVCVIGVLLRRLNWPFRMLLTQLMEALFSYLVLCHSHKLSEAALCLVIAKECSFLEKDIVDWGSQNILAHTTVTVEVKGILGEGIGWKLDEAKHLSVAAVEQDSPAEQAGITPQLRLCKVAGKLVSSNAEANDICERSLAKGGTIQIIVAGSPLPPACDRTFKVLLESVSTTTARLCLLVHYVFFDMCMYFLTDFAQAKGQQTWELCRLLVLHLPHGILLVLTMNKMLRLNEAGRKLERMLHEVAVLDDLTEDRRHRIRAFQELVTISLPQMWISVCGFAVTRKFARSVLCSAVGYIRLGPLLLKYSGLRDNSRGVCCAHAVPDATHVLHNK